MIQGARARGCFCSSRRDFTVGESRRKRGISIFYGALDVYYEVLSMAITMYDLYCDPLEMPARRTYLSGGLYLLLGWRALKLTKIREY